MSSGRVALIAGAAAALLAGCGGSQSSSIGPEGAMPQRRTLTTHAQRRGSWMLQAAKRDDLLYVADWGAKQVYIYTYPKGVLVGTLSGFGVPSGNCVDKTGDVWIVDQGGQSVVEYPHGGTIPIHTLAVPGGNVDPIGCSVDATTGNLAVTSWYGGVYVYPQATGTPKNYTAHWYEDANCAYDASGNLYIDGAVEFRGEYWRAALWELPAHGNAIKRLHYHPAIDFKFGYAAGIQWDGAHISFGNLAGFTVYRTQQRRDVLRTTQTLRFDLPNAEIRQFWIRGKTLIAPFYTSGGGGVAFFNYPAGSEPSFTINGLNQPYSATVSPAR